MNNKSCIYFAAFVLLAFLISKLNVHFEFGDKRITETQFDEITNRLAKCEAHAKSWHVRKVPTAEEICANADEIRRVETNSAGGVSVILKAKPQPFDGVTYIQEL